LANRHWIRSEAQERPDLSVLIVSFNTEKVLRECLQALEVASEGLKVEVIVIDNASRDQSVGMLRAEWPDVHLIETQVNLGFGGANNKAYEAARGRYIVLLNSDAFLAPDALRISLAKMEANPEVGLAGGRLISRDGGLQPSARSFPALTTHILVMSGLADRYPKSKFFGQADRTWANPMEPADVDWVPGAYSIIRDEVLREVGFFDPIFFLYYEEVDLCYRIKAGGYRILYWPDIVVVHIGGESSRQVKTLEMSHTGAQLVLWRMRSTLLYYRKHKGALATRMVQMFEVFWYQLREWRNRMRKSPQSSIMARDFARMRKTMQLAWTETKGGRVSPPQPW